MRMGESMRQACAERADIGWGYGDFVHETVDELEEMLAG